MALDADQIRALEACSTCHCGCCKDGCPIYSTMLEEQVTARGRNLIIRAYLKGIIGLDERLSRAVYSCLLCRLDEENCGARLPNADIYESLRAELVEKGFGPLPEHQSLLSSLRNYGNPWMQPKSSRDKWIKKADLSRERHDKTASRTLYYAGCTFPLDPGIQSAPAAFARLLELAGEEFALLGREELCCGSTALRIGDRALFDELSRRNAEMLSKYDRVTTSCSGCFKTIGQDYPRNDESPEIIHSVQMLLELIRAGKLSPRELNAKVTYHDPCHLGRHSGIYDEPRDLIRAIPGVELIEMRNSRELARCCGAGAGVKTAMPDISSEIAKRRVEEACDTGTDILISACPFCIQSLKEAAKALNEPIKVMDISELLLEACE